MQKKFKRDLSSLDEIFDFIHQFVAGHGIDGSIIFTINLVVEELFTNMVKYNQNNRNDILLQLEADSKALTISLTDFDVPPFDITKTEEVNVGQHLEQRRVGGLGIHLVKQMMDHIHYEYHNGTSKITLIKDLER